MQVVGERSLEADLAGTQPLTTLDREAVDDQLATGIVDLFRGQPGVFVQQTTPGQGIPIIRGLKGSEVLHLVDGFRVNNALFRNAPNQYLALIDPNGIGSIDLIRGPPGTLYGSDAMGGVVQFVSHDPWQQPPVQLRLRGRSNDPEGMAHAAFSGQGRSAAARLGLTRQHVGDRRTGAGQELPSAYRSEAADAAINWSLSPRQSLSVLLQYVNQPRTSRVDQLLPGFGETAPQASQADFAPNRRHFGLLRYSAREPFFWIDELSVQLGRQLVRDDRESRPFESDVLTLESNRSTLDGLRLFATSRRPGHVFHLGVDAYRDRVASSRSRGELGAVSPISARFPDGSRQSKQDVFSGPSLVAASFCSVHWGARYSRADLDVPRARAGSGDQTELIGHLG